MCKLLQKLINQSIIKKSVFLCRTFDRDQHCAIWWPLDSNDFFINFLSLFSFNFKYIYINQGDDRPSDTEVERCIRDASEGIYFKQTSSIIKSRGCKPMVRSLQLRSPVVQQSARGPRVKDFAFILETSIQKIQVFSCDQNKRKSREATWTGAVVGHKWALTS